MSAVRFELVRTEDESGVSGTGVVADGAVFRDHAVLEWKNGDNDRVQTSRNGLAVYEDMEDLLEIHGHDGKTTVRWVDDVEAEHAGD